MKSALALVAGILILSTPALSPAADLIGKIECTGQINSDLTVTVTGKLKFINSTSVFTKGVAGLLDVTYSSTSGVLPPVLVPLRDVFVSGKYESQAAVNGGEYLTVKPSDAALPLKAFRRSYYFENGFGPRLDADAQLADAISGQLITVPLKCK